MGLIKTAMLASGGMYAVNKLAKVAENRHSAQPQSSHAPQNSPQTPNYSQGYWGPQGQQQNGPYAQNGQYNDSQQQRQWSPQGSYEYRDRQANNPPPYYQQPQAYTGDQNDSSGFGGKDGKSR
jgi:hypothetical protein